MNVTKARRAGLDALAAVYPEAGRVSNVTDPQLGYVYWQTANWLLENDLVFEPSGYPSIALTPRGIDVVNDARQCRECGCTDNSACDDGCAWVKLDLCSACAVSA